MRDPNQWAQWLSWAKYWYNTTFHVSINITPFIVVYGQVPPPLVTYGDKKMTNDTLEKQSIERDCNLLALKEHLCLAQKRMKKQADKNRRDVEFQVGSWCF